MLKELEAIDTSSVQALSDVNKESTTVQELMERARAQKEGVPEPVVQRVMKDYGDRLKALENRARPLREKARIELARLRDLRVDVKASLDALLLDEQELKFRLRIGELKPEEFEAKEKKLAGMLAEAQENFDSVERVFEQFAAVLPHEEAPPGPPNDDSTAGRFGTVAADHEEALGRTVDVLRPEIAGRSPAEFTTVMIPLAHLVRQTEGEPATYGLGALTTIGRTTQNHIALDRPEVSRHHANIEMTESGWLIKDLGSGNGTFVNDVRINEQRLQDGDRIVIGTVHFVFRQN
jgi:hypothetical protein